MKYQGKKSVRDRKKSRKVKKSQEKSEKVVGKSKKINSGGGRGGRKSDPGQEFASGTEKVRIRSPVAGVVVGQSPGSKKTLESWNFGNSTSATLPYQRLINCTEWNSAQIFTFLCGNPGSRIAKFRGRPSSFFFGPNCLFDFEPVLYVTFTFFHSKFVWAALYAGKKTSKKKSNFSTLRISTFQLFFNFRDFFNSPATNFPTFRLFSTDRPTFHDFLAAIH